MTDETKASPSGVFAKYGGRRFIMCMGAGIIFTILLLIGKIEEDNYQFLILATVGAYITANTVQKGFSHDK